MSRSKREGRQCRRRGCACRPRKGAQRWRYSITNDLTDPRASGSNRDIYADGGQPRHVEPRWFKDRRRSAREFDRIADAKRNHRV